MTPLSAPHRDGEPTTRHARLRRRDVLGLGAVAAALAANGRMNIAGRAMPAAASESPHWSYAGEAGPERWGALDPAFAACASGRNQSPIDLADSIKAELPPLVFRDGGVVSEIAHLGHTVQADFTPGSGIEVSGRPWQLRQAHFHVPSEHRLGGRSFAMEAHLVHRDERGNLAVVAVLLPEGRPSPALTRWWTMLPERPGDRARPSAPLKASELLPRRRGYYRYSGSLTTPPCSEGVLWLVLRDSLSVSSEQVAAFRGMLGQPNSRPLQPAHARAVLR